MLVIKYQIDRFLCRNLSIFGRSEIIGFQKTQYYQRFAGNHNAVFTPILTGNLNFVNERRPMETMGGVFI